VLRYRLHVPRYQRTTGLPFFAFVSASSRDASEKVLADPGIFQAAEPKRGEDVTIGDPVIIQILLTLLHHPGAKAAGVVRYLRGHSPPITMAEVRIVFTRYELDSIGKKGGASNY